MKTSATTPRMTAIIIADAASGIGSLRGNAAQLSLPSILGPLPGLGLRLVRLRAGAGRQALLDDALEQVRAHIAVGERRYIAALPGERGVVGGAEDRSGTPGLVGPR